MYFYDMIDDWIILENIKGNFIFILNDDFVFFFIFFILDCKDGFYGKECLEKCICKLENMEICGNVLGICICRVGWNGIDCFVDVDECKIFVNICLDNLDCINLNGIYLCICKDGFFMFNNKCIGKLVVILLIFDYYFINVLWVINICICL